ncbi:MAG: site-2 protease family protein [Ruminococcus sp.]|nr:site-2 protease family protein [Ruminococcus sp.]
MGIVVALIIFGIIVTVHEFGHFICAKLSGISVLEFSVGMGPKLIQKEYKGTMYSLRLLPVGGYCAMEGEDSSEDNPHSFRNAKLWKRMIVLAAGAFMNFILGMVMVIVMVCMMFSIPTTQIRGFSGEVSDDGTKTYYAQSYKTGLQHDDIIVKIDGTAIYSTLDLNYMFAVSQDETHDVVVKRNGKRVKLEDVTFHDEKNGGTIDFGLVYKEKNPLTVLQCSGKTFLSMGHMVTLSLKQLVTGKIDSGEVSGPVGVVSAISDTTKEAESAGDAVFSLAYMTALITINLGIFNLLPIPGLDGGRLLFCLIELIRRKPVKPEHEGYVHLAGMVLLFGVMIFATFNDIMNLIERFTSK